MSIELSRRQFLKSGAALGVSVLFVGMDGSGAWAAGNEVTAARLVNPFVRIASDGSVTVIAKHFEMGQGTATGLATLVAEELDVPWESVSVEFAPSDNALYANLFFKAQGTGGSTAIANSFMQYRTAGAGARELLVRAAASTWGVGVDTVALENGILRSGARSAPIGAMLGAAADLSPIAEPRVKDPSQFRLIGNARLPRQDSAAKTDGSAVFAMDVKVPNMVYVTILRPPRFGGKLASFDASQASKSPGFLDAKAMPNGAGVLVYADSTYASIRARRLITAQWDDSGADSRGNAQMLADHRALLDAGPQFEARPVTRAAAESAVDSAPLKVEAEFVLPLLAHAPMEPLNCVIEPTATGVRVHDGCQFPGVTHPTVAAVLKLKPEQVEINTVYAGGSFGRRATPVSDYHVEAALAFAVRGGKQAVKLVWTREDDLAGGFYRPMAVHRARIGLDKDGRISGWAHHIAAQSIAKGTPFESVMVHDGVDHASVEGVADTPYQVPNMAVGISDYLTPRPCLWWRSVGHSHSAYVMEVLMDMAAAAAGQDPVAFRLAHLDADDPNQARLAAVLRLAAEKAGWGTPLGKGKGRGIAVHKSFNTYVAEVAEVSVRDGKVSIDKVTCAVDCGVVVNPDVVRAQMEGGIGFGLGAIMRNQITLQNGIVEQANFPQYEPLRISDMPHIDVHMVNSAQPPTGVGEPGTPPAGPALANAIAAATGQRIKTLPMSTNGVVFS